MFSVQLLSCMSKHTIYKYKFRNMICSYLFTYHLAISLLHPTLGGCTLLPTKLFIRTAQAAGTAACRTLELRPGRSPTDRSTRCRDRIATRLPKRPKHKGKRNGVVSNKHANLASSNASIFGTSSFIPTVSLKFLQDTRPIFQALGRHGKQDRHETIAEDIKRYITNQGLENLALQKHKK